MDISLYLKSIGKTKVELSDELNLSRPTLNQYIEQFETGQKIENERYAIIFRRLFSDPEDNRETFEKKLFAAKKLLERDKKYDIGCLDPEAADIVAHIHNKMVHDMSSGEWSEKVYNTIIILISRYKDYSIFRELAGYISDLNSDSDLSDLSQESKAYYSYYYKCFKEIRDTPPSYISEIYDEFIERKKQLSMEREARKNERAATVQNKIDSIVKKVILEYQENGNDATEAELMNEVIRRMSGKIENNA